jgi:PAS domain S-box-containing protein
MQQKIAVIPESDSKPIEKIVGLIINMFESIFKNNNDDNELQSLRIKCDSLSETLKIAGKQLRRSEEQLRERDSWLSFITENSHEAAIGVDPDGHIIFANKSAIRMLGFKNSSQLICRSLDTAMKLCHPNKQLHQYSRSENPIYQALKHRRNIQKQEAILLNQFNEEMLIEFQIHSVIDDGATVTTIVMFHDITTSKLTESQLEQHRKMNTLGETMIGISHDFNNLLTVIQGNLELLHFEIEGSATVLSNTKLNELRSMVEDCSTATDDGIELTSRLLTFTRKKEYLCKTHNPHELLQVLPKILGHSSDYIDIHIETEENLPCIKIDKNQFDNAMLNLVINARDAISNKGKISISAKHIYVNNTSIDIKTAANDEMNILNPGSYVLIEINDNGHGIPKENLEDIFDPFYTTKKEGNGFGLSMVANFVKQSSGHIHIESRDINSLENNTDHGTTISIYLPATGGVNDAEITDENSIVYTKDKEKILLVEDDLRVRKITSHYLNCLGYDIAEVDNPEQAMSILSNKNEYFDLILSDVIMPGELNGRDLFLWVKSNRPEIPIGLMSGHDFLNQSSSEKQDLQYSLLKKPYTKTQLANYIRSHLDD